MHAMGNTKNVWTAALAVALLATNHCFFHSAAARSLSSAAHHAADYTMASNENVLAAGPAALRGLKALKETKTKAPPCTRGPFTLTGGNKLSNEWRAYNGN